MNAPRILSPCARLWLLAACTLAAFPAHAQDLPARLGRVNDFAEVLDATQRNDLEAQLVALERDTSVEVAVVTLRALGGRTAQRYAHELFNAWGIGRKGRNSGVLILVAVQNRAVWIDAGEGGGLLVGILPMRGAGAARREVFLPNAPAVMATHETYGSSLLRGTHQVIERVRRNDSALERVRRNDNVKATERRLPTWFLVEFGIFVSLAALALGTAAGAKVVVPSIFGVCVTVFLLYALSMVTGPRTQLVAFALLVIGLVALGFVLGRRPIWRRRLRGPGNDTNRWVAETIGWPRYVLRLVSVTLALVLVEVSGILRLLDVPVEIVDGGFRTLSATWIHAGIATGALLVLGARMWPAIAATVFLIRPHWSAVLTNLTAATHLTVGSLTCWWLAKRYAGGLTAFPRVEAVVRLAACALVFAAVYAAGLYTMPFAVLGHIAGLKAVSSSDYLSLLPSALLAAFLGIIIVTPVITLWATGAPWRWSPRRGFEFAAVLAVTTITGWLVFGNSPAGLNQYPIPFLVLPVLLWPAFRLGARETVVTTLLLSVLAMWGSAMGLGPFVREDARESMFLVQLFLAVCALGTLAVAAEVGRREAIEAEVRALNEDLEHRVSVRAQELVRAHAKLRRTRVRHAAAMRGVHARIASDLHDSVGASLSRIAILSDLALRESAASATTTTGALTKIGDNARAVIDEMSDAVWFVDPKMEDVQQMVVRLRMVAAALFESNGTDWDIDAAPELLPLTLTADQRRNLFLILKEALTNVHRHAHATVVRVAITATDSGLRAVVDDNGTGLLAERTGPGHGNGLINIQKRARELTGALSIQSRPAIVVDVALRH